MVIEKAEFTIHNGMEAEFEETFFKAVEYIQAAHGYESHQLTKSIEAENKYVIFVDWSSIEDHTEGFMKSEAFQKFVTAMDPFIDKVEMEHLVNVLPDKKTR